MKKVNFEVRRPMHGDREYAAGDTRSLSAIDAAGLVRSGALVPKDKAARDAMAEVLKDAGGPAFGVQRVSDAAMDANNAQAAAEGASPTPAKSGQARAKDAGAAERNKADVTTPPAGAMVHAGEPGVAPVDPASASDAGSAAAGEGSAEGEGGDEGKAAAPATTAAPSTTKAAAGAKAAPGAAAKRRR